MRNVRKTTEKDLLRKEVLDRQKGECAICHINFPEVLCLHHKDWDHMNNDIDNLQALCFNCHFLVHMNPKALHKVMDWRQPGADVELFLKIREIEKKTPVGTKTCIFHENRKSDVLMAYDLLTGKPLPTEKVFGLCQECWGVVCDTEKRPKRKSRLRRSSMTLPPVIEE